MTISAADAREVYDTDGVTTEFDFHFRILEDTDLEVYYRGPNDLTDELLIKDSHYTISASPWPVGGSITLAITTENLGKVTIRRNRPYSQVTVFPEGGKFPSQSVEDALDSIVMMVQQVRDEISRSALKIPVSDTGEYVIPNPEDRANKYLVFDSEGNPIVSEGTGTDTGLRGDLASVSVTFGASLIGVSDPNNYISGESVQTVLENHNSEIIDLDRRLRAVNGTCEIIAHRGFLDQAPQNTLLAFSSSLSRGARSWETDVQPSADGTLYLFHDDTVDALTDGTGTFTALTDATIDGLRFDETVGTMFADTKISKFTDFLALAKRHGIYVYLEIKAKRTDADIDAMAQAVIDAEMENFCMFTAFDVADLQRVRQTLPDVPIGLASFDQTNYQMQIDAVAALGGEGAIVWAYEDLLAIPDIVDYAQTSGLDVIAWTVDSQTALRDLMTLGVRRIMTDISLEV